MIERLIISRFRGIRKGVLKDLGKFNLIVGPNNSGKTAVLEALYWLSICGRKCSFFSPKLNISTGNVKIISDDIEVEPPLAFVPINKDLIGYSPCPRLWKRHGKTESWEQSGGNVSEGGTLSYKIKDIKEDEFLKDFRLIPPQAKEIEDIEKFKPDDEKSICLFVLDNPRGMGDMLKYYFRDMYPDAFSYPEDKMRRFAFTWFPDFIYLKQSLGAWGIEGITADADCVLFYDFHTTSEPFNDEFYEEVLKRGIERRLKEYFKKVFLLGDLGDFDVSIQHYPDSKGAIQGIIKPAGYFFSWDEIPGNGGGRLISYLKQNYGVDWVKTAKIEKINDGMSIKVSIEKNSLLLELNDEKTEVNLKIDDGRTDEFIVKKENGKLNIYSTTGIPAIPIDDFGDGARHAFKVLAALTVLEEKCKNGKEGIFLWEDPELFMHPATIKKLIKEIINIVKDKQIQVFISTQSLEVLANIAKLLDDKFIEEKDVRTYTLNLVNGELNARKFWGTALSDWLHSGFDPRLLDVSEDDLPFSWHLKKEKTEEEPRW